MTCILMNKELGRKYGIPKFLCPKDISRLFGEEEQLHGDLDFALQFRTYEDTQEYINAMECEGVYEVWSLEEAVLNEELSGVQDVIAKLGIPVDLEYFMKVVDSWKKSKGL